MSDGKRAGKRSKSRRPQRRGPERVVSEERAPRMHSNSSRQGNTRAARFDNNEFVFEIRFDRNKGTYLGSVSEIPELAVQAPTADEVYKALEDAIEDYLVDLRSRGGTSPEPLYTKEYPETLNLAVSQGLYRRLDLLSRRERSDLEKLAVELLTAGIEKRGERQRSHAPSSQGQNRDNGSNNNNNKRNNRSQGGGGAKGRYQNYHQTMDNRENFLDYVRRLEKGRK